MLLPISFLIPLCYSVEMLLEKATAVLLVISSLIGLVEVHGFSDSLIGTGSIISAANTTATATAWLSTSGKFAFGFYWEGSGFAVGIQFRPNRSYSTVIWTADRDQQPISANATLTFGNEGLVLHDDDGDRTISNLYDGTLHLAFASMSESGNFVVYDVSKKIAWQTFDNPTDTLMEDQMFGIGTDIVSSVSANNHSSGRFRLTMQRDGNIVLYPVNTTETVTHANWASGSDSKYEYGHNGSSNLSPIDTFLRKFKLQNSSEDTGVVRFLKIEADGFLRIYSTNKSGLLMVSEQYPAVDNKCLIKGACGLNSYCNSTGKDEVSCFCLPGYVYIDQTRVFAGCQRYFTKGSCDAASTSNRTVYIMYNLQNITWTSDSYGSSKLQSADQCRDACLRDCDCYAGLFFSETKRCSKERYPIQYGRALSGHGELTVAFFKIGLEEQKIQTSSVKLVSIGSLRMLGTLPLLLSLLVTATFAVALDFLIFFMCRNRIRTYRTLCESMETGLAKAMAPQFFSYRQLEEATDGYKEEIGEGSQGKVFKGLLPLRDADTPIAVKKLKRVKGRMEEKFRNELKSVGRVHHRNLVRLLGFCHEGSDWILVYEYMSGGSLADLIFKWDEIPLSWKQRMSIAMDVARGLYHLHEGCDFSIIHGDIKPENILIGNDNRAKIGDLGLAKHLQPGKNTTYTHSIGTFDYKAPEWANSYDSVSPKVDVISFGVLLLELICLKKYRQPQGLDGEYNLASWSYKCLNRKSEWQVPGEDVDSKELEEVVKVALWCLHGSPEKRPSMFDVVMMLSRKRVVKFPPVPLEDWNVHRRNF